VRCRVEAVAVREARTRRRGRLSQAQTLKHGATREYVQDVAPPRGTNTVMLFTVRWRTMVTARAPHPWRAPNGTLRRRSAKRRWQSVARRPNNSEAETLNRERQDMIYNRMTPQTTVDAFDGVLARHDNRLKTEVLRRLGEGKTPAEQATLESNIRDIFEAHQNIETPGQLNERVQPAPATPRELVDRPDANGKAQGSRTGDHVYDVPICDGLKAVLRDNPSLLEKFRSAAAKWADPTPGESITVYSDITDGAVFRAHPELGINADSSDGYFFHLLMFDDAEVPSTTDPTRTILIPNGVEREAEMISLDEIWSMIVLWPQSHTPTEWGG